VVFKDEPDTGYTIFGYNSSTRNGIAGFTFTVSGPDGTQTLFSGSDGFAKPSRIGRPEIYTIIATPPNGMEMATPGRKEFNPCEEKQIDFGAYSIPPLRIDSISPPDKSRMGSDDVLFTWRTSEGCKSELYIRQHGSLNYTVVDGQRGTYHTATAVNLTRNEWYDFYVKANSGSRIARSNIQSIFIDNGISFAKVRYDVTIERNYSQSCPISVKNTDTEPHELRVGVNSSARDIYFNFLGGGSSDKVITLAPGETRTLDLVIHAQDARERNYTLHANLTNLGPEKIVDNADIYVNVHWPVTLFNFEEVGTDSVTLTKTLQITNLGDPITDLSIIPDDALLKNTVIQPSVRHMALRRNETIDIQVSPLWSEDIGSISGTLTASAANFSKTLDVDFSCKEGRQLHKVVLSGPQLHFDLKGGYCVNQHPITDSFTLPPGLKAGDVLNAYIGMELNAKDAARQLTRYSIWVKINDNEVGRLSSTIPSGYYKFSIDPSYFGYTQAGLASNKYVLDSDMNRGYTTLFSDVSVVMCLKNLTLYVCAENEQQAKEIAWSSKWLYKPSNRINVKVLSPMEGENVTLGQPVAVKVRVEGENGGEKYCIVSGSTNGSNQVIHLVDNGQHGDDLADDGVYAGLWIPDTSGRSRIDISAGNCAVTARAAVTVVSRGFSDSDPDLWLSKIIDPQVLDAKTMNTERGNAITYTIALGPRVEGIKDVRVIQNLPGYLRLNNNSLSKSATVNLNHDGRDQTSIVWDIGELREPWSVTFDATFNWRLPAGANYMVGSTAAISAVTYTSATGSAGRLEIPDGEIGFAYGVQEPVPVEPVSGTTGTTSESSPGVGPVIALLGILSTAYVLRRR
jgi:PGF-CTERM protein